MVDLDAVGLEPIAARRLIVRIVRRVARRAAIDKPIGPDTLRHALITAALDAGVPLRTSRKPPRAPTPGPRCTMTAPASPSTGTPPTRNARTPR
jgi:hypothetical protein